MKYRGYDVVQADNGHISVSKDGVLKSHIPCSRMLTDEALKIIADEVIGFVESGVIRDGLRVEKTIP